MSPFFGIKVLMAVVVCIPIISLIIYFLIRPLPTEIPADAAHFNAGLQFHREGRLDLAIAEYDLATEINSANLEAFQKRGDAYFAKGELGRAVSDYNAAISLRSLLISGLGSQKRAVVLRSVSEAYMGKALVYARQGRDLEAQRITTQAVNFGYDPVLANKVMDEMIERRENSENIPKEWSVPSGLNN